MRTIVIAWFRECRNISRVSNFSKVFLLKDEIQKQITRINNGENTELLEVIYLYCNS